MLVSGAVNFDDSSLGIALITLTGISIPIIDSSSFLANFWFGHHILTSVDFILLAIFHDENDENVAAVHGHHHDGHY